MDDSRSLLLPPTLDRLVGVIDIQRGQAVHAVAGQRDRYQPVTVTNGNAIELARRYRRLGIRRLYIADLDAIQHDGKQSGAVDELLDQVKGFVEIVIDAGWTGAQGKRASLSGANESLIRQVVSTESTPSIDAMRRLCDATDPRRIVLSLDYRNGHLISRSGDGEGEWMAAARTNGVGGVIVLDLADVGTDSGGSGFGTCRRLRESLPDATIFGGGGIRRAQDVRQWRQHGCDFCLVATAIHRIEDH